MSCAMADFLLGSILRFGWTGGCTGQDDITQLCTIYGNRSDISFSITYRNKDICVHS